LPASCLLLAKIPEGSREAKGRVKAGKQPASKRSRLEAGFFKKTFYKSMREAGKQGSRQFLKKKFPKLFSGIKNPAKPGFSKLRPR
jgi:hypothetical protein